MRHLFEKESVLPVIEQASKNENGAALIIGLMFLAIIAMAGSTAVILTSTDLQIGANYKTSVEARNVAQAGINEALYRLGLFDDGGTVAPPSGSMINVNNLPNNNAAISIDPNGLLTNTDDDDGNGLKDDPGDLNYNGTYDNRNWKAVILLSSSTPAGVVSNTTFFTNTIQPSADWLEYSSSTDDGTALIIEFLKEIDHFGVDTDGDGDTNEIVFYNGSVPNPYHVDSAATPASGHPVVVITSTGRTAGTATNRAVSRTVVRAVHHPINVQSEAAVMVDMTPDLTGSALISGFNHVISTTSGDEKDGAKWHDSAVFESNGVDNHGGYETYTYPNPIPPPPTKNYADNDFDADLDYPEEDVEPEDLIPYGQMLETAGHKPGVWTPLPTDTVAPKAAVFGGDGTTAWKKEGEPFWLELHEILGISQATLMDILAGANVTEADVDGSGQLSVAPQGLIYINNPGGTVQITASTPDSNDGWGLMYVKGGVDFQSLTFRGLIFVEEDAKITSSFWLLGSIAIKGTATGDFSAGNGTFLYSRAALEFFLNKGMKYSTLAWEDDGLT